MSTRAGTRAKAQKPKSRVNEAGNYTKPTMRKNLIKSKQVQKVEKLGSGQQERHKCLQKNTKLRAEDTHHERCSSLYERRQGMERQHSQNAKRTITYA